MKNLNTQLNNLKNIKPGNDYKNKNRELLLTQIYNTAEAKPADFSFGFSAYFQQFSSDFVDLIAQPAMVVGLVLVSILGGGLFGATASKGTKPGDSLYVAKRISEKTQLALTFGEKEKVQLRIGFAGNRVEEIEQVLADNKQNEAETKKTVDDLVNNVKSEVGAAKTGLQKISKNANINAKVTEKNIETVEQASTTKTAQTKNEEDEVFSANLGKENAGISTKEREVVVVKKEEDSKALLTQAKESLKSDDVAQTLSALEKVDEAIDKTVDSGEVKGVEETATTTELKK
ncbi:DUF5667 domain-containing protein [Candidatus Parcubacteria bacterium]|nr:hypothetical protein [Patescibacteria group bacterium]MBU4308922.1 hypothetical protein [Patescibacteria group bacterium]MBU4431812.1 hypothetical protein [Patescibacteria group bacterium]MBU4577282.1 hypothetical protein [Patescibacteria group bacterium]MCG2696972.1 DUF5667 domain-containing protein [Candidatus Parcubacteria bacterium]